MKRKFLFATTALLLLITLWPAAAHADNLTLTLSLPTQNAVPGGTVTFTGTLFAPADGTDIFLYAATANSLTPLILDTDDFFGNFPLTLSAGDSFTADLFTVTLPSDLPVGFNYTGTITLQGGPDSSSQDVLVSTDFSVNAIAATPEPPGLFLLATGLAGVLVIVLLPPLLSQRRPDSGY